MRFADQLGWTNEEIADIMGISRPRVSQVLVKLLGASNFTSDFIKVIEGILRLHSERADNWIAEDVGVFDHTVSTVRERLESTCEISKLDELIGKDGGPD